jgi:hypothetical protein
VGGGRPIPLALPESALAAAGAEEIARASSRTRFNGGVSSGYLLHFSAKERLVQRARENGGKLAKKVFPPGVQKRLREEIPRHRAGGSVTEHLSRLRDELDSIALPPGRRDWLAYEGDFPAFEPSASWSAKQTQAFEILNRVNPASVLDLGSNRGWYSLLAARRGAAVVAVDRDSTCVSRLYSDALADSAAILPLIMDIRDPSPARGLCGELCPSSWERLSCELVLALALVHHLTLGSRLTFEHVVRLFKRFTKRYLLVEFPMASDPTVAGWIGAKATWYTSDNFRSTLSRHFRHVEQFPSETETRQLYFCEGPR